MKKFMTINNVNINVRANHANVAAHIVVPKKPHAYSTVYRTPSSSDRNLI